MAARKKTTRKAAGGRGSATAIEKRRSARQLNALLAGGGHGARRLDGRTEKRRKRLVKELKDGRAGKQLKPIDVVTHVNELLELGETFASLRKQGVKPRRTEQSAEILEIAERTQQAYGFRPEVWKMLGISLQPGTRRKGPSKGKAAARKRR